MTNAPAPLDDLRDELRVALAEPVDAADPLARVRRLARSTSLVIDAFAHRGMRATLVGGGAIEFHTPTAYTTDDIDLVVDQQFVPTFRADLENVFTDLGFARRGRHWERDGMFVEVPGVWMSDPVEEHNVGGHTLRVVRPEVVLADRIVGFRHWGHTAYGIQAAAMLDLVGDALDDRWLRERLTAEGALDAYVALAELTRSGQTLDRAVFDTLHARLTGRSESPKNMDDVDDDE